MACADDLHDDDRAAKPGPGRLLPWTVAVSFVLVGGLGAYAILTGSHGTHLLPIAALAAAVLLTAFATMRLAVIARRDALHDANHRLACEVEERRSVERALRTSESRQAVVLRSAPLALYVATLPGADAGVATWVSEQIERISGFRPADFVDRPGFWASRIHPDHRQRVRRELDRLDACSSLSIEYPWLHRDGTYRWMLDQPVVSRDEHGMPIEVIGTWLDISEHRRTEQQRRESEERYRTLVEHAPEAIVVFDFETRRFADANVNAERLFKRSRAELLAGGPEAVSPKQQPDGRCSAKAAKAFLRSAIDGGTPVFEWMHEDRDGRRIPCEIRLVRLPSSERRLIRGSITDISERKRSESRIQRMMRELDHRVKNNLAAVLTLSEQTLATCSSLEEFRERFSGRIFAMARTHEELARKHWAGLDLAEAVRRTVLPFLTDGRRQLHLEGAPTTVPAALASPLGLALHELATNAIKHGALSSVDGQVEVKWTRPDDHQLLLTWIERGGPDVVAPESKDGLGLGLLRGLVEHEMGGHVNVRFDRAGLQCELELPGVVTL